MRIVKIWLALAMFLSCAGAGNAKQKESLMYINKTNYSNFFKYFSETGYILTSDKIFYDKKALREVDEIFFSLMRGKNTPFIVSLDNRKVINTLESRVKREYPDETYKYLEDELFANANPWRNLGIAGSADLLISAALTGPMVGLDIVSGGLSKVGKVIAKGGKTTRKFLRIGRNFKELKILKNSNLKKIAKAFTKFDKKISKTIKYTAKQKKMIQLFESDAFSIFKHLLDKSIRLGDTVTKLSITKEQQRKLIDYKNLHKDDPDNILAQYLVSELGSNLKLGAELLNKSASAMFIDIFQTGILSAVGDTEDTLTINDIVIELGLKGAEFVPLAGPIIETVNKNREAMKTIENNFLQAKNNYLNFGIMRKSMYDVERRTYMLLVIEDTLQKIYMNDDFVASTTNIDETFGVAGSISNIATSIREWDEKFPVSYNLFYAYQKCLVDYSKSTTIERENKTTMSAFIEKNKIISGNWTCDIANNNFRIRGKLVDEAKESKIELFLVLSNRTLYNIYHGVSFNDVFVTQFYYPYVYFLAYKNIYFSNKNKFYPNQNLTQSDALLYVINMFFRKEYAKYIKNITLHSDKYYFDFLKSYIKFDIPSVNFANKENSITRKEIAQLLVQSIYRYSKNLTISLLVTYPDKYRINLPGFKRLAVLDRQRGWTYFPAILKAFEVTKGYSDGSFGSSRSITRGEASVLLTKSYKFANTNKK